MLILRLVTAFALILIFLAALFLFPEGVWVIFCALIMGLAGWEWQRLTGMHNVLAKIYPALTAAGLVALYFFSFSGFLVFSSVFPIVLFMASTFFWLIIVPCWLRFKWRVALLGNWNAMLGWFLLFPAGLSMLVLRGGDGSLLLAIIGVAWIADTAAYFSGRLCGRHQLAPQVSPGKTWEGVGGALIAVIIYCVLLRKNLEVGLSLSGEYQTVFLILAGFLLLTVSIMGDLLESLFKRQRGIKESSHLLPGHGGVLDRVDSLLALLPLAATFHFLPVFYTTVAGYYLRN